MALVLWGYWRHVIVSAASLCYCEKSKSSFSFFRYCLREDAERDVLSVCMPEVEVNREWRNQMTPWTVFSWQRKSRTNLAPLSVGKAIALDFLLSRGVPLCYLHGENCHHPWVHGNLTVFDTSQTYVQRLTHYPSYEAQAGSGCREVCISC